jgi:YHS domain-containing protein
MISKISLLVVMVLALVMPAAAAEALKKVETQNVCMVTDVHFAKKQIPIAVDGKTYYGCCEMCKKTLGTDSKVRAAIDPVTKKPVDKAKAVIAARADNSVLYFESEKTFQEYQKKN